MNGPWINLEKSKAADNERSLDKAGKGVLSKSV
jgi:hypothetical protein